MSVGFLRLSGSKRGSVCFGKIWRFPASHPTGSQHRELNGLHMALEGLPQLLGGVVLQEFSTILLRRAPEECLASGMTSVVLRRGGFCCGLQKCPGGNASSLMRWLFSSFKKDFSTRIVTETTLGLFMDHKDYGGTNFAIFFVSQKIMYLLYVVNLQFV